MCCFLFAVLQVIAEVVVLFADHLEGQGQEAEVEGRLFKASEKSPVGRQSEIVQIFFNKAYIVLIRIVLLRQF